MHTNTQTYNWNNSCELLTRLSQVIFSKKKKKNNVSYTLLLLNDICNVTDTNFKGFGLLWGQ